jgi:DNA-binding response OmpR family regulator
MGEGSFTVLIVNSDPGMREYLCEQLSPMGIRPECSDSIRCALKKIADLDVDAIVCDETLKDGAGIELIERLKRCGSQIPTAILLSGSPDLSEISALARGAEMVFQKPFGLSDFVDGIRTLVGAPPLGINARSEWFSKDSNQNYPHRA